MGMLEFAVQQHGYEAVTDGERGTPHIFSLRNKTKRPVPVDVVGLTPQLGCEPEPAPGIAVDYACARVALVPATC